MGEELEAEVQVNAQSVAVVLTSAKLKWKLGLAMICSSTQLNFSSFFMVMSDSSRLSWGCTWEENVGQDGYKF